MKLFLLERLLITWDITPSDIAQKQCTTIHPYSPYPDDIVFVDTVQRRVQQERCSSLQWRYNEHDGASSHRSFAQPFVQRKHQSSASLDFEGNLPVNAGFLSQSASYAENVSICWRHHDFDPISWGVCFHEWNKIHNDCAIM